MTLQKAFEQYCAARREEAEKYAARKDAEERAAEAVKDHQRAKTSMDNALAALNNVIKVGSDPENAPQR